MTGLGCNGGSGLNYDTAITCQRHVSITERFRSRVNGDARRDKNGFSRHEEVSGIPGHGIS